MKNRKLGYFDAVASMLDTTLDKFGCSAVRLRALAVSGFVLIEERETDRDG